MNNSICRDSSNLKKIVQAAEKHPICRKPSDLPEMTLFAENPL
jgi:hypothetical protein